MIRKLIKQYLSCSHDFVVCEQGDLVRGGSSLAAGAVIGEWQEYRCSKCDRKMVKKKKY